MKETKSEKFVDLLMYIALMATATYFIALFFLAWTLTRFFIGFALYVVAVIIVRGFAKKTVRLIRRRSAK